ncbi:TonB-dependent receptor [Novosphingobium sp. SG720]|uniref:TonB-dependent receptor n=1 Tax=Novosphingobium sp. SG720 TaxID=2586998 RepID=UPI001445892F|nr:TonB-dependent receptor [Novosphingobium sp. SG720]NKJ42418.1 outer membrane receptor protein involved in Fe transport [Novosphingobium sp. SG720]
MSIKQSRSRTLSVSGFLAGTALCCVPCCILGATPALAQDAAAGATESTGGDIVVTASKRTSSTIQNTPIAVQALGGEALKEKGAIDFADFYHAVPALSVQDEGPGDKRYVIRGINSAGASTVGLYLDETVITGENSQDGGGQAPDIKLFDISRVEVLKGPQGTTFGASSMAGTIRYITAKADVDAVSGYAQSALRATKGASLGLQTDGAVNLPIVPGVFAVRASGFYADLPGWIDNRFQKGANAEKSKAGRLSARLQATPDLTVDLMAMYQDVHQDAKNYYNKLDYDGNALPAHYQADQVRAPYGDQSEIYNATVNYKQPFGTFTGTVSRFVRDTSFVRDASLAAQAFLGLPYGTTGLSALKQDKHRRVDSGELRFASSFDGPFQILVGGFFQNENRFYHSAWPKADSTGNIPANAGEFLDRTVDTRIKERALFGEASYEFVPGLTFTAGGRLFDFKLEQVSVANVAFGGGTGAGAGPVLHTKDNGLIGRFNLAYKLSSQVNTYIQIAQGYRSGGTNDQTAAALANVVIPDGYGSDSLWSYEWGVKSTLLDRKLFLNGAVYYIDWTNIQVSEQATDGTVSFGYTGNGGKATVKGFEMTLEAHPIHGLEINLSGNYNTAKLARDNPVASTGRKGDRIPYVPEVTGSASIAYTAPIDASGLMGSVGADASYQGSTATKFNSTISNYQALPSYWLVGLRAGVNKGPWSVNLNVTNLFNDQTTINFNEIVPGVYPLGYYTNRPRTVSLSAMVKF